jgi:hypothetical protein
VCTVTWFHEAVGYQLFFNRDERRARKPAVAPALRRKGSTRFIAPLDGNFGGSWIGVNEHGLTLGLLNGYSGDDLIEPPGGYTSRGLLLSELIDSASIPQLSRRLRGCELDAFRSFLFAAFTPDGSNYLGTWRCGKLVERTGLDPDTPLVSSSFESEEVRRGRVELFGRMSDNWHDSRVELHLGFHESHLPERGPYSVCMHRPDAETVSLTWIKVDRERICFRYAPHSPCAGRPRGEPLCFDRRRTTAGQSETPH